MELSKQQASPTDEIDLFELFAKIILSIKNNIVLIVVAFLVGSFSGLAYYKISPKVFESEMLISSDILTESYGKSLIDNLDKFVKEGSIQSLSKKLNLSPKQASAIDGIKIKSALEAQVNTLENAKIYLLVEVKLRDNSIWPQLQNGLIDYLQNNEFAKIRTEQKKKYTNEIIDKINLELVYLEKLKARIADGGLTQSTKEYLVLFDPTTINSKIIDFSREKINLQNSLETISSVQVVEGFSVFKNPVSPKLSLSLAAGSSLGLFFAALIIAFRALILALRRSEEKLGA